MPMPDSVVRAKARLAGVLVGQLDALVPALAAYQTEIERFFVHIPAAAWARTLPASKTWHDGPDAVGPPRGRARSLEFLAPSAGVCGRRPGHGSGAGIHVASIFALRVTNNSATMHRSFAFLSFARVNGPQRYYRQQRARGHGHRRAFRALAAKWLKILFVLWTPAVAYDETHHLATMARQALRRTAVIA